MESAGSEPEPVVDLTERIHFVRGLRVMLDSDLAAIYGVSTMRLNEQVKRNARRFPSDFAFVLTNKEFARLISQNAISKRAGRGGRRTPPVAFTEYGAIMPANVLKSERASDMSVFVVRAFVRMRELLTSNATLSAKLSDLEKKVASHDDSIAKIIAAIRELINPREPMVPKREIGFHVKNSRSQSFKAR